MAFVPVNGAAAVAADAEVAQGIAVKGWQAVYFLVFADGLFSLAEQLVEVLVPCF